MTVLLEVRNLSVGYAGARGAVHLVEDVSFDVRPGEAFGIVGESGCGKSTTIRSVIRLLASGLRILGGTCRFDGQDLAHIDAAGLERVRGGGIGMVFQDPLTALNPVMRAGAQIAEGLRYHAQPFDPDARMHEVMRLVGLPDTARIAAAYPHELSGGQRQRVALAMALACAPRLLLADEPTTALDVTIQDQILRLLTALRSQLGMALVLVTHDLGVIGETCDRVGVMYAGRIVEQNDVARLFAAPSHPYTAALLGSIPRGPRALRPLSPIPGLPPDPAKRPAGCAFAPRCQRRLPVCETASPAFTHGPDGAGFACHNPVSDGAHA